MGLIKRPSRASGPWSGMAGSVWTETRRAKGGEVRVKVKYRMGGRETPARTLGTFSQEQAERFAGEARILIARGIDPALIGSDPELAAAVTEPAPAYTYGQWLTEFERDYGRYRKAGPKRKATVAATIKSQLRPT